jgi:hypothetical protein
MSKGLMIKSMLDLLLENGQFQMKEILDLQINILERRLSVISK